MGRFGLVFASDHASELAHVVKDRFLQMQYSIYSLGSTTAASWSLA